MTLASKRSVRTFKSMSRQDSNPRTSGLQGLGVMAAFQVVLNAALIA